MRTIFKLALGALFYSSVLMGETVFDLTAQHFSNSLDGQGEGARYDLPKTYVSTALKYEAGHYGRTTSFTSQKMDVEIKTPLTNWSVSFDMSYHLSSDTHPIRFIKPLTKQSNIYV